MRPPTLLTVLTVVVPLLGSAPGLPAQEESPGEPGGWEVRTDRPDQDPAQVDLAEMPPGWHVTTGPAAILWQPDRTASGEFAVEMEVFLFDPRGRREAFGFFAGGQDLKGPDQRYVYFLIREGGEFLVKRRSGERTEVIVDWTRAASISSWADRSESDVTARNVLALEAGDEDVRFLVNGEPVVTLSRGSLSLDGTVGMRVNHGLNLHVSRLDVRAGGTP